MRRHVFPGGIAGASLKLEAPRDLVQFGLRVFPGGIAGASLKRVVGEADSTSATAFSPAESPGPH